MIVITDSVNLRNVIEAVAELPNATLTMFNDNHNSFKITRALPEHKCTGFAYLAEATNGDVYIMEVFDGGYRFKHMETREFVTKHRPVGNCTFDIYYYA